LQGIFKQCTHICSYTLYTQKTTYTHTLKLTLDFLLIFVVQLRQNMSLVLSYLHMRHL